MSRMHSKARLALIAALGVLLAGGGTAGVLAAQSRQQGAQQPRPEQSREEDRVPYRSSIQVPDDEADEQGESDEADSEAKGSERTEGQEGSEVEGQDAATLQSLARISVEQAKTAALTAVPGTVTGASIENEDGNLVYGVRVRTAAGVQDVKVDAGNGKILHVEKNGRSD